MTIHRLKTDHEPFLELTGAKTAEFRRDDRGFAVGDYLDLVDIEDGAPTGQEITVLVTHIERGYGIPDGYAMLSFELMATNPNPIPTDEYRKRARR